MRQAKTIIIILFIFILGILAGILAHAQIIKREIRHFQERNEETDLLSGRIMDAMDLSAEKREKIRPILLEFGKLRHEIMEKHRFEMESLRDSLKNELLQNGVSTEEWQNLERAMEKRKRFLPPPPRKHFPKPEK
ncbi:MAG: hypothetical protein R2798_07405 [Chitinophagales bacterium]|nr:hypothetical protein [Bacteroidota bacterium]